MIRALSCLAILACTVASPALGDGSQAHRLTDKEVRTLLDDIRTEIIDLEASMDPNVRKSILRSQLGETDVQAFFKDLRDSRDKARNRLGTGYSASTEVGAFLRQASAFELRTESGWSLYGAEGAWRSLRPLLVRLADAYGIDWTADPSTWRPRRKSDGEIEDFLDELVQGASSFRKAFQKDLKGDPGLAKKERRALVDRAVDVEDKAEGLADGFRRTLSVATGASRLEASMDLLADNLGERPMGSSAEVAWTKLRDGLQTLSEEFDLVPVV